MKSFFKLLLLVAVIVVTTLGFLGYQRFSAPGTAEMNAFFSAHQPSFENKTREIRTALSQKTEIQSGADDSVGCQWLEIEPSHETYRGGDPLIVRYYTHLRGVGTGAFGTGIAYLDPGTQEKIYPNLEAMMQAAKQVEGFLGYSHISGHWYTFFWEAD